MKEMMMKNEFFVCAIFTKKKKEMEFIVCEDLLLRSENKSRHGYRKCNC